VDVVRRYLQRLTDSGLSPFPAILIGVAPLRSAKSARWMREKLFGTIIPDRIVEGLETAKDPGEEGRRICLETIAALAEIPAVAGCHIMAPGNDAAVPLVIADARRSVARLRHG
jgi:methylenetetrahydrofolate reductase (NADPH)